MSVNEIDVNAVNRKTAGSTPEERVVVTNTGKENKTWAVDDEHLRRTSNYLRHSFRGKMLYRYMMFLMFVEGILWSLMDATRAKRMKVAETITKHRHNDRT